MYQLKYGDTVLKAELPESWRVTEVVPRGMPSLQDPAEAVRRAIEKPVHSAPLSQILAGARDLVIVVSDKTRVTGAETVLPVLLDTANEAGIPDPGITILFACGTHSLQTEEERRAIVGEEVAARVNLVDHDCHAENLVSVGTTAAGTPVRINPVAYHADRLVITGTAQFHYFAGFGGGRKSILPGIAAEESIIANHAFTMSPEGGRNPHCRTGRLDGNELNEDMTEACRLVAPDFLVNVVLSSERKIAGVFAGDWERAHREACETVVSRFAVHVGEKADVVIVSPGGYPKDINYIQSHKAYDSAFQAVKKDGVVILAAECRDGLGNEIIERHLALADAAACEAKLKSHFYISGHTALAHKLKAEAVHTVMITGMNDDQVDLLGVERAADMGEALHKAKERLKVDAPLVYVIPDGYTTLPRT